MWLGTVQPAFEGHNTAVVGLLRLVDAHTPLVASPRIGLAVRTGRML